MIALLKKCIPQTWRETLRPWRHRFQDEAKELAFQLGYTQRQEKLALLQGLKSPQDIFKFAQDEFYISQNRDEILPFLELAQSYHIRRVGEIGTYMSGNAFMFSQRFSALEKLIAVDLRVKNRNKLRYYAPPRQDIVCIHGFSCADATLQAVQLALGSEKFDLAFIDGDHKYSGVRQDLLCYSKWVRTGGLIAFHDIVPDHFIKFGRVGQFYSGEVYLLWRQLKRRFHTWEFITDPDQNGAGIGVIECDAQTQDKLREIAQLEKNQD